MPPKKRDRDASDDAVAPVKSSDAAAMDIDELKAMLRDSLEEKAKLQLKIQQFDRNRLHRVVKDHARRIRLRVDDFCFYVNPKALDLARAGGVDLDADTQSVSPPTAAIPSEVHSSLFYCPTATQVVQVFEEGLPPKASLTRDYNDLSTFNVLVLSNLVHEATIPAGKEKEFIPVAAISLKSQFSHKLLEKVDPEAAADFRGATLLRSKAGPYPAEVQEQFRKAAYNDTIRGIWCPIPAANGVPLMAQLDLDLDQMRQVRADGFTNAINSGGFEGEEPITKVILKMASQAAYSSIDAAAQRLNMPSARTRSIVEVMVKRHQLRLSSYGNFYLHEGQQAVEKSTLELPLQL